MSVRLRLRRMGAKNKPAYRVVAADQRCPRDGKFIEILGFYDPRREQEGLDLERAEYWLSNGAQPSQTVADIIRRAREGKLMTPPEKVQPEAAPVKAAAAPAPATEAVEEAAPAAQEAPVAEATSVAEEAPAPAEEEKDEEKASE